MPRLQILIFLLAISFGLNRPARAGSLNLYQKPGTYLVRGQLEVTSTGLSLIVFKNSLSEIHLRLKLDLAPKDARSFLANATAFENYQLGLTGDILKPLKNQKGVLEVISPKIEPRPPDFTRPSHGDGFWLLKTHGR